MQQIDPLGMKDPIGDHCHRTTGSLNLEERIGIPKSEVSRRLSKAGHRFGLPILLDLCAREGFSLTEVLQGNLQQSAWSESK